MGAGQGGTGWRKRQEGIFITDRSQETLLCASVFLSGGKGPGLFI